ncbi:MAG: hypothetical protein EOO60_01150 [Hymenobacter sp.]|nr:MAG: hypothetical protein EOO60_01150 [Hymenobacter sp.]
MPRLSPKSPRVSTPLPSHPVDAQVTSLETRYQELTQQFRAAQLQFQGTYTHYCALRRECDWLQQVVCRKQHVIEHLLPFYPHPLTSELITAIELY